jgi:hypothetical protein
MTKIKDLDKYDTLLDVQSSDSADQKYEIRWSKQYGYYCQCAGWQASKKKPKVCKHIKRFVFKQKLIQEKAVRGNFDAECVLAIAKGIWKV